VTHRSSVVLKKAKLDFHQELWIPGALTPFATGQVTCLSINSKTKRLAAPPEVITHGPIKHAGAALPFFMSLTRIFRHCSGCCSASMVMTFGWRNASRLEPPLRTRRFPRKKQFLVPASYLLDSFACSSSTSELLAAKSENVHALDWADRDPSSSHASLDLFNPNLSAMEDPSR
jgi:hypothetical protein